MGVLTELDITGPMPLVLNAPALANQSQQGFWGGAHTGHEPMDRHAALAPARRCGDQLHDPGTARPVGLDVLGRLFRSEVPAGLAAVPCLQIRCCERDAALSLELVVDLPAEDLLILFDAQEKVAPLAAGTTENACVVCNTTPPEKAPPTAWISTPSSFIVLSSSLNAERSLDSWVSKLFWDRATPSALANNVT